MKTLSDIGLVGLGVMGRSLALNMESKGFQVSVFNYISEITDEFLASRGAGKDFIGARSYEELAASLQTPRKVFLMVTAGKAVDAVIAQLLPVLGQGDIIIDGGNSNFEDTRRRAGELAEKGLQFIGCGVSGGEEGALKGPSMMPGCSPGAWEAVKPIFQKIAAKAPDGTPCCDLVGPDGAGHFVKMVHNGIEYGDIQLICECYQLMRDGLGMSNGEMQALFADWNTGDLDSYLIGITADILGKKDDSGAYVLDTILDTAGQKGTGKWTVEAALDAGVPLPLIGEAVFARCLSARRDERLAASGILAGPAPCHSEPAPCHSEPASCHSERSEGICKLLPSALLAAKIISYAQGFTLMQAAAEEYGWPLDYGRIAGLWRGGCIIRSVFLDRIKEAYDRNPALGNLMLDPYFSEKLSGAQESLRRIVGAAITCGIPVPALASALSYYDGIRCPRLGANLLQAQRDYFGAHTYERTDRPRGQFFHTRWTD